MNKKTVSTIGFTFVVGLLVTVSAGSTTSPDPKEAPNPADESYDSEETPNSDTSDEDALAADNSNPTPEQGSGKYKYHGQLKTKDGPVDGKDLAVDFSIYASKDGGESVWSEKHSSVSVDNGRFDVILGDENPLDIDEDDEYWLEVQIEDDVLSPRQRLSSVLDAHHNQAAESDPAGKEMVSTNQDSIDIDRLVNRVKDKVTPQLRETIQKEVASKTNRASAAANAKNASDDATNFATWIERREKLTESEEDTRIPALESDVADLDSRLSDVEDVIGPGAPIQKTSIKGEPAILVEGVNLHVRNGSGSTTGSINGVGNLIIGYDEGSSSNKNGSHNLVMGKDNKYNCTAGIVAGKNNNIQKEGATITGGVSNEVTGSGTYASVSGGFNNTASGSEASVTGGAGNSASGPSSSVTGGLSNSSTGFGSSVLGGSSNTASANYSAAGGGSLNSADGAYSYVAGGSHNTASSDDASVFGGWDNEASGMHSVVTGGGQNKATDRYSIVSGGRYNEAEANYSVVAGGGGNSNSSPDKGNHASENYAAVFGGSRNETTGQKSVVVGGQSGKASGVHSAIFGGFGGQATSDHASTLGGFDPVASGLYSVAIGGSDTRASGQTASAFGGLEARSSGDNSVVVGGSTNKATSDFAAVFGGSNNTASDIFSTVSGGRQNTASGPYAKVSGGRHNTASGNYSTVSGGGNSSSGQGNTAKGSYNVISGGKENKTKSGAESATIAGGAASSTEGENTFVAGTNVSLGSWALNAWRVDGMTSGDGAPSVRLDRDIKMNSNQVTQLADPTDPKDSANKRYVDSATTDPPPKIDSITVNPDPSDTTASGTDFSASVSDGKTPYSYSWTIKDPGSTTEDTGTGNPYTYSSCCNDFNTYTVELTVTDDNGKTVTDSKNFEVIGPSPSITVDYLRTEGDKMYPSLKEATYFDRAIQDEPLYLGITINGGDPPCNVNITDTAASGSNHNTSHSVSCDSTQEIAFGKAFGDTAYEATVTDNQGRTDSDTSNSITTQNKYITFLTDVPREGNLGSFLDQECTNAAANIQSDDSKKRVFMAWVTTNGLSPAARFHKGALPKDVKYWQPTPSPPPALFNNKIADSWSDLTDGTIDNTIHTTHSGNDLGSSYFIWTNVDTDGTAWNPTDSNADCDDWNVNSPAIHGVIGQPGADTGFHWTAVNAQDCNKTAHVLCIQQ